MIQNYILYSSHLETVIKYFVTNLNKHKHSISGGGGGASRLLNDTGYSERLHYHHKENIAAEKQ